LDQRTFDWRNTGLNHTFLFAVRGMHRSPNRHVKILGTLAVRCFLFKRGGKMQEVQPRGLRRAAAAAYIGISPSHFDKERAAGTIPAAKQMFGVVLWDRHDLDSCFDGKPVMNADNDNSSDYWDRECATGNLDS
jgi:hypothetical protein